MQPKQGQVYALDQILKQLLLPDTPHLGFFWNGQPCVIQDAHLTADQLLSVRSGAFCFGDTKWRYLHTTNEEIPVFEYSGELGIELFVDIQSVPDDTESYWVTPKGHPREWPGWAPSEDRPKCFCCTDDFVQVLGIEDFTGDDVELRDGHVYSKSGLPK